MKWSICWVNWNSSDDDEAPTDAPGGDCPEHGPYVEDCDKCE